MAQLGNHAKVTVGFSHREALKAVFLQVLEAKVAHSDEDKDIYALENGNLGFCFVPDGAALTPEQARIGAWLEIKVGDPAALRAPLEEAGVVRFDYVDASHDYYALPGGQVFRLARSA